MNASARTISVGDVYHLRCTLCNPPKPKFFVVAHVDPLRMFLINSNLSDFVRGSPEHVAAMALIRVQQHPEFLVHDSYIACDHLSHEYSSELLILKMGLSPEVRVGHLHPDAKAAVREALRGNALLAGKYLKQLRVTWDC